MLVIFAMSALGQKRTFAPQKVCPLYPESERFASCEECPLRANSGHRVLKLSPFIFDIFGLPRQKKLVGMKPA
jgi:hypothetical protein